MKKLIYTILYIGCLLTFAPVVGAVAQPRVTYTVNDGWLFAREGDDSEERVCFPHTWNASDGDDPTPGYYRGEAWYRRQLFVDRSQEGRRAILCFEGANQEVHLYWNDRLIGTHRGGYTRFCFDVTAALRYGETNRIAIRVSNAHHPDIPPLSADFTFYGGIYRDVYLQFLHPVHVAVNDYASAGVYIRTPEVERNNASVEITTLLTNDTSLPAEVLVEHLVCNADGKEVARQRHAVALPAGETKCKTARRIRIDTPRLWTPDDPYLYHVRTRILDKRTGTLLDEVVNPLGLRSFRFDARQGFTLNGEPCKLIGTARHQDYYRTGNALRDEMHVRDVLLLKAMGGNFLRVSHYPQDPVVMEMCDRLGILTSVEIPVVNAVTESEAFLRNAEEMAREMVRQNFNHPSVVMWGTMNEILLRPPYTDSLRLERYYRFTERVARRLDAVVREEDPSRNTMMAYHNAPDRYQAAHLTDIPMIQGWNLYQGWYEPDINEFQQLLDRLHRRYPDKVLMVTEYGPGVDPRLHSYTPERFDFSQEYGLHYHRHYLQAIMQRPFIAGFSLWNLNDFYSEARIDAVPHVNNKGITGLDREPKDGYHLYQATFAPRPVLTIGNRRWLARGGTANRGDSVCVQAVPLFSNADEVELSVNGKSLGRKQTVACCASFDVPFTHGENRLDAVAVVDGQTIRDALTVSFQLVHHDLQAHPFAEMNVMLGSPRYFDDRTSHTAWIPEQPYQQGSWGFVGGTPYRRKTAFGTLLGTDIDILDTDRNPLYQTQRVGIEAFKADVPDGVYTVCLYWAEIESAKKGEALVYNLGADMADTDITDMTGTAETARIFSVSINGTTVLDGVNLARDYGYARAVMRKFIVNVTDGAGLTIDFQKIKGEPVLNAIRIYKAW
jgi:beta-galactosidase